jgi:hypothetical protein
MILNLSVPEHTEPGTKLFQQILFPTTVCTVVRANILMVLGRYVQKQKREKFKLNTKIKRGENCANTMQSHLPHDSLINLTDSQIMLDSGPSVALCLHLAPEGLNTRGHVTGSSLPNEYISSNITHYQ